MHPKQRNSGVITVQTDAALGIVVSGGDTVVDVSGCHFWACVAGTNADDGLTEIERLNELFFYGCYFQATYSDGSRAYSYPNAYEVVALGGSASYGGVDNPTRAMDGSLDTSSRIWRLHFSSLGDPVQLHLSGFGEFTATPAPSVPIFKNFAF